MSTVLGSLKERLETAKVRLAAAQQRYQAAGVELQAATNDYNIWNAAVTIEMREEERRLAEAQEKQLPMNLPDLAQRPNATIVPSEGDQAEPSSTPEAANKTELVREMLRLHPTGITVSGLWTEIGDRISSRAYLYSILKRLRDRDEVFTRRKRYLLRPRPLGISSNAETGTI